MSIQSGELHKIYIDASSKSDHFLLGAIVAACAYLAQSNPYALIGTNPQTLFLVSLIVLGLAGIFAHMRVEQAVQVLKFNAMYLRGQEELNMQNALEARMLADKYSTLTGISRRIRNLMMMLGFLLYVGAKLWTAYQLKPLVV